MKEEMEEAIFREDLIDDNNLILYKKSSKQENGADLCVRFIENDSIKEHYITTVVADQPVSGLIDINDKGIAVFEETPEGYRLKRLYSLEEHSFSSSEFMDLEYKQLFPEYELSPQLIKKRREVNDQGKA